MANVWFLCGVCVVGEVYMEFMMVIIYIYIYGIYVMCVLHVWYVLCVWCE